MTYVTAMQGKGTTRVYLDQNGNVDVFSGGSRAARNHNPGNLRYGDFAIGTGAIGRDKDGFAIFPDSETGTNAHQNLLSQPRYQQLTIDQAIAKYAPPEENDTSAYQNVVKNALGLSGDTPMSSLSADQLKIMVNAMETHEGYTEASYTTALSIGDPLQNYRSDFDPNDQIKADTNDNGVGTGKKTETESASPANFAINQGSVQVGDNNATLIGQDIHVTSRGQEIDLSTNTSATISGGGRVRIIGNGAALITDTNDKYDITVAPGVTSGDITANNSTINLSSGWLGTVAGAGNAINQAPGDTPNPQPSPTPTVPAPSPTPTVPAPDPTPTVPAPDPTPTVPAPSPTPTVPAPSPTPTVPAPDPTPTVPAPSPTPTVPAPSPTPTVPAPSPTPTVPAPDPTPTVPAPDPTPTVPAPDPTPTVPAPDPTPTVPAPDPTPTVPAPDPTPTVPAPDPTSTVPAPDLIPGDGDIGGGDIGGIGEGLESATQYVTMSLSGDPSSDRQPSLAGPDASVAAAAVTDAPQGAASQAIQLTSAIAGFSPSSGSDTSQSDAQTETHATLAVDPSRTPLHQAARHTA